MSASWASLAGALRYGYAPYYVLQVEGIPVLFCEHVRDAIAPTGYTLDASLIIDRSASIGAVIDEKTHCSKGFDLDARLLATPAVKALIRRPKKLTALRADVAAGTTSFPVTDTSAWTLGAPGVQLYIGQSCATYGNLEPDRFTSVLRSTWGALRTYKRGTLIADVPYVWKGRRVTLWMVLLDPSGRFVQGADILSSACALWEGHVQERPDRDGAMWILKCRDQVRRLSEPLGVAASGQATWALDDDQAVYVDTSTIIGVTLIAEGMGAPSPFVDVAVRPFAGQSSPLRRSQIRALIAAALQAKITSGSVGTLYWDTELVGDSGGVKRYWRLIVPVQGPAGTTLFWLKIKASVTGTAGMDSIIAAPYQGAVAPGALRGVVNPIPVLRCPSFVFDASLSVVLDSGVAAAELPTSGWVVLEVDGESQYRRYIDLQLDPVDARKVNLRLDPTSTPTGADLQNLARSEMEGTLAPVSVRFVWRDSGRFKDVVRRALASSGDAVNGAWDTLPRGQGLDLPHLDATSFDVFDGGFTDLRPQLGAEAGISLEKLVGGLLRLSRRGLTTRRAADGSSVEIAAVSLGSADVAVPVARITDASLVASQGRRPVRLKKTFAAPQAIAVKCRTIAAGLAPEGDADIVYKDDHLLHWTPERLDLDVYGLARDELFEIGKAWATAWFRSAENRQLFEVDLAPWETAQVGDIVELELADTQLWDFALETEGLVGFARVLGVQVQLTTGLQTMTLAADGMLAPGPLCPSLPILAVNGTPTAPTSIDVAATHYDLLTRVRDGAASWAMLAYRPGQDSGRAQYTIGGLTLPGGGVCRLAVTASPSAPTVSLSTAFRLTFPVKTAGTTRQGLHLHTSDLAQWSS